MAKAQVIDREKVLVIGVDGATWDLLTPWIKTGMLPNMKKLVDDGASGDLKSVLPIVSPAAWSSFSTGMSPESHGIFGYQQRSREDYKSYIPLSSNLKAKWFWEILGETGKKSIIINIPGTYPPRDLIGVLVAGEVAPEITTYPPSLAVSLKSKGYKIESKGYVNTPKGEFLEDLYKVTNKRAEIGLQLMEQNEWDLFVIVFTGSDRLQHFMWGDTENRDKKYGDAMMKYFQRIDGIIGEFVEKSGGNSYTIIVSDHGFGRLKKRFYLDKWLEEHGYLKTKDSMTKRIELLATAVLRSTGISEIIRNLMILLGMNPEKTESPELEIDTANSVAFSSGYYEPAIYINRNLVNGAEYEKLREEIIEKLKNLKDPETSETVILNAVKADDIYNGMKSDTPDILIESNANYSVAGTIRYPWTFENKLRETGTHRIMGIFIANGKHIKSGAKIENASLIDVAPTILSMFGVSHPQTEGKILDIFK